MQVNNWMQRLYYDENLKPRKYDSDDLVWRWYPPWAKQKLGLGWRGPYKVIKQTSTVTYLVECCHTQTQIIVHVDHLKSYWGERPINPTTENEYEPENDQSYESNDYDFPEDSLVTPPDENEEYPPYSTVTRHGRIVRPPVIFSP